MQTDVLIVGGGLAGLALADQLARAGADFQLIEARDQLGGRILTQTIAGGAFDLGPAWFWPGQPRIEALVRRFDLPVFEQYASGELIYQDHTGAVQRGHGFASMQGSLRLDGGLGRLIDSLASGLPADRVMISARLISLTRQPDGIAASVERSGSATEFRAKRVVLALPPRVIAETVRFDPALEPEQTKALAGIPTWMAGQAKIVAVYSAPHWRQAGLSGDAMSQRGPMVEIHDASPRLGGPYALFGFVGVPPDMRAALAKEVVPLALAQLETLFGPAMATPLDITLKDWATVPEVATTQDHAAVTHHPRYGLPPQLRTIWDDALLLGSTETGAEFGGFLEGALEAAEACASALHPRSPG